MKIKNIITTVLFSSFSFFVFAQVDKLESKDTVIKKWSIAANINTVEPASDAGFDYNALSQRTFVNGNRKDNSYCVGLYFSYKIKENCAIRLSAKMTDYKITETRDFREFVPTPQMTGSYSLDSLYIKQMMLTISPGIIWNSTCKKLNFYGGIQAVYRKYGTISGNTTYTDNNYPSNIITSYQKYYQTEPGGFSIGIGTVAGFSVKVFKSISIGSEFSTAYSYYKTGGAITSTKTNILPTHLDAGTTVSEQTFQGFKFSSLLTSINLSVSF